MNRLLLLAVAPLAACSQPAEQSATDGATTAPPPVAAAPTPASPLALAALSPADYEAEHLPGELACSFTAEGGTRLAMSGNVADRAGFAEGFVKVGETRLRGRSEEAGGFDPLPDGTRFTAEGFSAAVELTSNRPLAGGESPPMAARLIARWADGTERTYEGTWTCGP